MKTMKDDLKARIDSFRTIVICEAKIQDDILHSPFSYLAGDFSWCEIPHFKDFSEMIASINKDSEICMGIGYQAFCRNLEEEIRSASEKGGRTSFVLPFFHPKGTRNFLMTLGKNDDRLDILFAFFDRNSSFDFDTYAADSFKDHLTGLFNYNTLIDHLKANRKEGFLCLFDLNKFKAINDTFGHAVGDDVLSLIASFMISISSVDEFFYRRSGDEFMILIQTREFDYATNLIGKLEDYLESIPTVALKQYKGLECSASFGLLELRYPKGGMEISYEDEIKLTDLAMYQAKGSGKRIHFISHQDALSILESGKLDERLDQIAASISR